MFIAHLLTQMKQWRAAGDEIIPYVDANNDLYQGKLAQLLQGEGLLMIE